MALYRRHLLATAMALPALGARAADSKTLRMGFQKGEPILMAAKVNQTLEKLLAPQGYGVQWVEFQFGPPMLEAMRVGSIDFGAVGDTPPIFAQAARGDLRYVAAQLAGKQAILLPAGSAIKTAADLKGRKLAFGRGSAAHNFALMVLEKAGLRYDQIEPVYLGPADAGAAFERGAIDAWSIWDPYYALFENRPGVRILTTNAEIGQQNSFFIANGGFVRANQALTSTLVDTFTETAAWARDHKEEVATLLAGATGMQLDVMRRAIGRDPFVVRRMDDALIQSQQKVADRFRAIGLVPVDIKISDIVWRVNV
ncbi:MAG: sulfonate transport system substrate-binding protein [Acetobacteraceae bacterium]|nr:sulfonate transport system substrate-binding protein [Acetobacteraceae bacterium]